MPPSFSRAITGHSYTRGQLIWTLFFLCVLGVKCNNEPPQETQTLMAHHLIALLFSSVWYTTSPCMKSTHPLLQHHTTEIHPPHPTSLTLSSLPVHRSLSSPRPPSLPQLFIATSLFLSVCICISMLLLWIPPPHFVSMADSVFSADVPLVSSGLAGRQQKWLWDWGDGSLVVTDTELLWWAFNCEGQTKGEKNKARK